MDKLALLRLWLWTVVLAVLCSLFAFAWQVFFAHSPIVYTLLLGVFVAVFCMACYATYIVLKK